MKALVLISRLLLGLILLSLGLNGLLNLIPLPSPTGVAAQFFEALIVSHYILAVIAIEVVAGALLLANRFVPLALAMLAPLLVNILLYHVTMAPSGFAPALIAGALWSVLFVRERAAFAALWVARGTT